MNNSIADTIIFCEAMFRAVDRNDFPVPGGVAVRDGKIIAVGERNELRSFIGAETRVLDYGSGTLLIPAFCDSHMHLPESIISENGPQLRNVRSEVECVDITKKWHECHPESKWVLGVGWHHSNWDGKVVPNKRLLSDSLPNVPVCLFDIDFHAAWVNQKALDLAGINRDTPNPESGIIHKDINGEPTGYLEESAALIVHGIAMVEMERDADWRKKAILNTCQILNQRGITAVMDAMGLSDNWLKTMEELDQTGQLSLRIDMVTVLNFCNDFLDVAKKLQAKYPNKIDKLHFLGLKTVIDGVGGIKTAWMTDAYADDPACKGYPWMDELELKKRMLAGAQAGFGIHAHACGTRAVEFALDVYEEVINKGYIKNQRNCITHNDTVNDKDFVRYGQLGVVASLQPEMLAPTYYYSYNLYPNRFGPKLMANAWANRRLFDNAPVVSFSSDSPVTIPNPMLDIFRATQRVHDDGLPEGGIHPEQKVTLSECLWAYTYGGAYQLGKEDILGTLEVGKLADVTVLNNNLFKIDPKEYLKTSAKLTMINGQIVYMTQA